ncbi:hypothetical protein AALA17_06055 [Lactobacillaceae bacterium 24-114]
MKKSTRWALLSTLALGTIALTTLGAKPHALESAAKKAEKDTDTTTTTTN